MYRQDEPKFNLKEPSKTIMERILISSSYSRNDITDIPEGADCFIIDTGSSGGFCDISFFKTKNDIVNPNYEKEMEKYNKKYQSFLERHEKWEKDKKILEEKEKNRKLEGRKKLYLQLKKEFEQ